MGETLDYPKVIGGSHDGEEVPEVGSDEHKALYSDDAEEGKDPERYREVAIGVSPAVAVKFVVADGDDGLERCHEALAEVVREGLKSA